MEFLPRRSDILELLEESLLERLKMPGKRPFWNINIWFCYFLPLFQYANFFVFTNYVPNSDRNNSLCVAKFNFQGIRFKVLFSTSTSL